MLILNIPQNEKAAEIAHVSIWKILDFLRGRNVPLRYDRREEEKEIEDILIFD